MIPARPLAQYYSSGRILQLVYDPPPPVGQPRTPETSGTDGQDISKRKNSHCFGMVCSNYVLIIVRRGTVIANLVRSFLPIATVSPRSSLT